MKTGSTAEPATAEPAPAEEGAGGEKEEEKFPQWFREGEARDALFRGDLSQVKILSRGMSEEDIEMEENMVKALTRQALNWANGNSSRLFRKDYNAIRLRGA